MSRETLVWIQPDAPAKPQVGAPCNGCGVCCLAEPCPLGMLLSRRRRGACVALQWHPAPVGAYRCGVLSHRMAAEHAARLRREAHGGPFAGMRWAWQKAMLRWTVRQIGAGAGCDSDALASVAKPADAGGGVPGA